MKTGENMFQRFAGCDWWSWLDRHRNLGDAFNRAMQAGAQGRLGVLAEVSWGDVKTVVTSAAVTGR